MTNRTPHLTSAVFRTEAVRAAAETAAANETPLIVKWGGLPGGGAGHCRLRPCLWLVMPDEATILDPGTVKDGVIADPADLDMVAATEVLGTGSQSYTHDAAMGGWTRHDQPHWCAVELSPPGDAADPWNGYGVVI